MYSLKSRSKKRYGRTAAQQAWQDARWKKAMDNMKSRTALSDCLTELEQGYTVEERKQAASSIGRISS